MRFNTSMMRRAAPCAFAALITLATTGCGGSDDAATGSTPAPPPVPTADPLRANTSEGAVIGKAGSGTTEFLGIPYAKPPVGLLRWAPPQRPVARSEALQATAFGNACAQAPIPGVAPTPSEDCLYLNVVKPADAKPDAKLPVLVYIHGGAFVLGSGNGDYGPLVRRGVVVVSFNYRLGMLGYLANRALRTANRDGSLGNFAVMDMLAALDWVKRNVAAFGGDPGKVTIWGTSAGATQSFSLLQSPKAAGLFHRAVMQSGGGGEYSNHSMDNSLAIGDAAVAAVGCATAADAVACLRAQPVSVLLAQGGRRWRPTVDAQLLTQVPARAFETGNFNQVPVMIGGVYDEGTLFVDAKMPAEYYLPALRALAPAGFDTSKIEAAYALPSFSVPAQGLARAMGDALYACGNSARRESLSAWVPVYGWEFSDPALAIPPGPGSFRYGTAHGMDSYYFSDAVDTLPTYPYLDAGAFAAEPDALAKRKVLAAQMAEYLVNFVETGDPNGDPNGDGSKTPLRWPRFSTPANRDLLSFTLPAIKVSHNEFEQVHRCDTLWGPGVFPSIY